MAGILTLFSGSSGNCALVKNGSECALIDAGASATAIIKAVSAQGFEPAAIRSVFITHEHCDHIKGLFVLCKKLPGLSICTSGGTAYAICEKNPELRDRIRIMSDGSSQEAAGLTFTAFRTSHDAAESMGFIIGDGKCKIFGYATDTGTVTETVKTALLGCRAVVVESNHDVAMLMTGGYPYVLKRRIHSSGGHLSNEDCAGLITELAAAGTKKFLLAHLSAENNLPALALETARLAVGTAAYVAVAPRFSPSEEFND